MLAVQKSSTDQESTDKVPGGNATFVKVSMDGAPYLRKVDLKMYKTYQELSDALGKMFSSFTIGTIKFTSPLTYIEAVLIFYICNSP
jgi:auxin-responsive protein IAA